MNDFMLTTPVAFIIFNRPDTTARVFAEIAKARPPRLLVVGDGARANRPDEAERVAATRAIINAVDWPCTVETNFSETNLGCKQRVSSGIDWVFERVEEAIILEDDCLPEPSFFRFCQEMLERYRADKRIGMISGDNFQDGHQRNGDSYYFSRYSHIWGWASWRDRWQDSYDVNLTIWPLLRDQGWLKDALGSAIEAKVWSSLFDRMHAGQIDTWDFQWVCANFVHSRLVILPNVNLISNIGFGDGATHTTHVSELANMPVTPMNFPLTHPRVMVRDARADLRTFHSQFHVPFHLKVFRKLRKLLGGMSFRTSTKSV
ncbi:glycosyltransferase family 2 protein [Curvibacter sp. CHRR-16]|uniref:glycosyltransferase family 2 protein n=1 Tax=Curvibacter sp. CHRR-16 TaxID=2835872 RepID=UPI001BD9B14A|nr:glycosyltransferase family 2 protein [Curvibacter sp. CHRR-16]MBT0571747.1 glycosyltransferase family 2 protein [Curvibacter sp. CHRR-16]